jgi:hypothetical protein
MRRLTNDSLVYKCGGCGLPRYRHPDMRPCVHCVIFGHRAAIRGLVSA